MAVLPTNINSAGYSAQNVIATPIVWVDNEMYARNAYVAPGATGFFMERQNPRFYVKSCTLSGEVASFKTFEFTEVIPPPEPEMNQNGNYVTMDDFNKSMNEIKQLINSKFNRRNNKENIERG